MCRQLNIANLAGTGKILGFVGYSDPDSCRYRQEKADKLNTLPGLREWLDIQGYLMDTCLTAQDRYKTALKYFEIDFE